MEIATIGVYGFTEEHFYSTLIGAGIDTFCDLRSRRGMRGRAYAFANSHRLQERLAGLGIRYFHFPQLAPGAEIRQLQNEQDSVSGVRKRQRVRLGDAFIDVYARQRLASFNSQDFLHSLGPSAQHLVLFCVERSPEACHRSLVADHIARELQSITVRHLTP
jgi:uncharacterized protein (DUF488 family)